MKFRRFILLLFAWILSFELYAQEIQFPFQNPNLSTEERVEDLISRMTIKEKALQLFNEAPAIERLGVPAYNWWNEALHGVARAGKATVFPQAIGLAATFNEDLILRVATTISDEARAKHHHFAQEEVREIYTGLTFWSPNINIFRDPRWGRGQETYGEDPYLTGRMAIHFIKGLQGNDPKYFKTIATAKHFAVHSGPEETRHIDNIFVNDRDLLQTYLPAFKMAVEEANVQSIMCAYNRFRDQPCCGSNLLLQKKLREDFGFNGYVVSDCGAITDFYQKERHHLVERPSQAWGWSVASGTDLNCEESKAFIADHFEEALESGMINEADINQALIRLFSARFKLGLFDPASNHDYTKIPISVVGSQAHLDLALESSEESLVLLKNEGLLPLKKHTSIALIGPNANNYDILIGNYNGIPIEPITPFAALQKELKKQLYYAPGAPLVADIFTHYEAVPTNVLYHMENNQLLPGLKAAYFLDADFTKEPALSRVDPKIDFTWVRDPINQKLSQSFGVRWTGILRPKVSGTYRFDGDVKVLIDGKVIDKELVSLRADHPYQLELLYAKKAAWWSNTVSPQARFTWLDQSVNFEAQALAEARKAEVIVFCGGISSRVEGEEMDLNIDGFAHGDRTHLKLPKAQEALLHKLKTLGKPIIYVNFSGSALALHWPEQYADAIIQGFYPGERTGEALSNLLFGKYSPSGRLPVTFYHKIEDLPPFLDYAMQGRTYRYFGGDVLYPFGYGLSYTQFAYANLTFPKKVSTKDKITVSIDITNTGKKTGKEVVQLYIKDLEASVPIPVCSLADFKKISLKPGETQRVSFELGPEKFSLINKNYERMVEPGAFQIFISARSPDFSKPNQTNQKMVKIRMEGEPYIIP